uniref:Translocation and assembly module TamB n=1 Tax=Candidatus Kentrum sp. DK TaxID=2126562 RepID=A0A450SAW0_9GAMM|nr:MAG: translocation and assembly module TamB [Candidatus Kentron sp. DK]
MIKSRFPFFARTLLRVVLPAIFLSLVVALGSGLVLLSTESGSRWLIQDVLPGMMAKDGTQLHVRAVEGTLLSSLELTGISHRPPPLPSADRAPATTIERFFLQWQPGALLTGRLHVRQLGIKGVRYHAAGEEEAGESQPFLRLPLPPALQVDRIEVEDLRVAAGNRNYAVDRATVGPITFAGGDAPIFIRDFRAESGNNRLTLAGEIEPAAPFAFEITGNARAELPDGTPLAGEGSLRGDAAGMVVERIAASFREGRLEARGTVTWSPEPRWDLSVSGQAIDPDLSRLFWRPDGPEDWRGSLNLSLKTEGRIGGDGPRATLALERLDGVLRGYPVAASGRMALIGDRITVEELRLRSGENRLEAHGAAPLPPGVFPRRTPGPAGAASSEGGPAPEPASDLSWKIHAPKLAALWPGLAGGLRGEGKLQGSLSDPEISLGLTGDGIAYGAYRAGALRTEMTLLPGAASGDPSRPASRVVIEAGDISLAGGHLSRLRARGEGHLALERITLDLSFSCGPGKRTDGTGAPGKEWQRIFCPKTAKQTTVGAKKTDQVTDRGSGITLALDGELKGNTWSGTLNRADLLLGALGNWRLSAPAPLTLAASAAGVGGGGDDDSGACWQYREAHLCAGGRWSGTSGFRVKGKVAGLPWRTFQPWLPESLEARGKIAGHFHARGSGGIKDLDAQLTATSGAVRIRYRVPDRGAVETTFGNAMLTAAHAQGNLTLDAGLTIAGKGRVKGELRMGPAGAGYPLRGNLHAELPDLAPLAVLIPPSQVVDPEGALMLAFTVAGTARSPALHGRAELTRGAATLVAPGIRLHDLSLVAEDREDRSIGITGQAWSGPGHVSLNGRILRPFTSSSQLELAVQGENFQLVRLSEAEVLVSPDLRVASSRAGVSVEGKVSIPEAKFQLDALPDTSVSISGDEVIVGRERAESGETEPGYPVTAHVSVTLGDKVVFRGFGLDAGLTGSVDVDSRPEKPPMGTGLVTMKDGKYRAYGQTLIVERGRLMFAGPVTNPTLDVRATRRVEDADVTVGVEITGPLDQPLTELDSDPDMPESNILAYLLTGKALGDSSIADQAALIESALGLGITQSQKFTGELGKKVGLDTVKVQAGKNPMEESSLFLGKYLTPKLYVGYVQGIFENTRTFQIEYQLTDNLGIKASSGEERQGAELIYSIERE